MHCRMQKTQAMKQSDYGKYTEVKIEKDVIASTACVSPNSPVAQ